MPTASRYSSRTTTRSQSRAARAGVPGGLHSSLSELLALGESAGWVVSCYQKLEPGDRAGEKYRIKLKNRLRHAADRLDILGFAHADRETVLASLQKVEEHMKNSSNLAGGRGIAVFAARGFFRAVTLPHVLRSRVLVDRTPVVGELVALAEAGSRVLAVLVDRKSARLFDAGLDGAAELEGIVLPDATRAARFHPERDQTPGVGEYRFHNRIREEKQRHFARVADAVAVRLRTGAFEGLLIGGIGADPEALRRHLHPSITDRRSVGVVNLNPKQASLADVRDSVTAFQEDRARGRAMREVDAFKSALGTGWAVSGVEPTLRALARGQLSTLLVDNDAEVPGFRFSESGRLSEDDASGRGEGEPVPVADLLDDAVEDALRQRARVAVVHGAPARAFAQLGGMLRFRAGK